MRKLKNKTKSQTRSIRKGITHRVIFDKPDLSNRLLDCALKLKEIGYDPDQFYIFFLKTHSNFNKKRGIDFE